MSLIASEERTIEICSREILRLEKRERELEEENKALREKVEKLELVIECNQALMTDVY